MLRVTIGALAALLLAAGPAHATMVQTEPSPDGGRQITITGTDGVEDIGVSAQEFDVIGDAAPDYGTILVHDAAATAGNPIHADEGLCHVMGPQDVTCEDYDDTATVPRASASQLVVDFAGGNDHYTDTFGVYGRAPLVVVQGGGGNDRVELSDAGGNVDGGAGDDTISGGMAFAQHDAGPGNDRIFGTPGPDEIEAGTGQDMVDGSGGPDRITTRDADPDTVDCGDGSGDVLVADFRDTVTACEVADMGPAPPPPPPPPAPPAPVAAPLPIRASLSSNFAVHRRYTKITLLEVRDAEPGIAIEVRCKGRGCPWAKRTVQPGRTPKALKRARLRPGAKLEVWITKPGTIGKVVRIAVRRKQVPRRVALCLPPAVAGPARC